MKKFPAVDVEGDRFMAGCEIYDQPQHPRYEEHGEAHDAHQGAFDERAHKNPHLCDSVYSLGQLFAGVNCPQILPYSVRDRDDFLARPRDKRISLWAAHPGSLLAVDQENRYASGKLAGILRHDIDDFGEVQVDVIRGRVQRNGQRFFYVILLFSAPDNPSHAKNSYML